MDVGDKILIYQTEDGQTQVDVRMEMIRCGLLRHKWPSFLKRIEL